MPKIPDHDLFWEYEPILKKIAHWVSGITLYHLDEKDIYQDACVLLLSLLDLGKINQDLLCYKYIWQRIGWSLRKKLSAVAKREAILFNQYILSGAFGLNVVDKHLATQLLGCKKLKTHHKQVLYRFYCLGQDLETIAKEMDLPEAKIKVLKTLAVRIIRNEYEIEPKDKPKKWKPGELRIWGPSKPVDNRHQITTWKIIARDGKRGQHYSKYFKSRYQASLFKKQVEKEGISAFDK